MNRKLTVVFPTVLLVALCASVARSETNAERFNRTTGGFIVERGTFTGKAAIIDTQDKVDHAIVSRLVADLVKYTECNIVAEKAKRDTPANLKKASGANVVLAIIDDPNEPTMLLAPEEHWGFVNVAKLVDDLPAQSAKAKFLPSRARKEYLRGFSILCGGGSSQFPGNSMNAATVRELDRMEESIPADMIDYYRSYLGRIGVKPRVMVPYCDACIAGWAPAPTNEHQKAIWDLCRKLPTKGATIKYDPKAGK